MDRSRRATNPQNYNPDGTIKKGKKTWKYSNRYKKLKAKHGLYFAKGKEHVKQYRLKEPDKSKYEIYNAVKDEIGKSRNWRQLQTRLAEKGIGIHFQVQGTDWRSTGHILFQRRIHVQGFGDRPQFQFLQAG